MQQMNGFSNLSFECELQNNCLTGWYYPCLRHGKGKTMAWYAYCIAERQAFPELCRHRRPMPLSEIAGLFGNQTFLFPASDLCCDRLPSAMPMKTVRGWISKPRKTTLEVIADCFKHSTVLPFRFRNNVSG